MSKEAQKIIDDVTQEIKELDELLKARLEVIKEENEDYSKAIDLVDKIRGSDPLLKELRNKYNQKVVTIESLKRYMNDRPQKGSKRKRNKK